MAIVNVTVPDADKKKLKKAADRRLISLAELFRIGAMKEAGLTIEGGDDEYAAKVDGKGSK